jgi:hypothetical protein
MKDFYVTFAVGNFEHLSDNCTKEQLEAAARSIETIMVDAQDVNHAIYRVTSPRGNHNSCRVISVLERATV